MSFAWAWSTLETIGVGLGASDRSRFTLASRSGSCCATRSVRPAGTEALLRGAPDADLVLVTHLGPLSPGGGLGVRPVELIPIVRKSNW